MTKYEYPECWNDNERMDFLFSALEKNTDSVEYKTKVAFLSELVIDLFGQCEKLEVNYDTIKQMISRNGL